MNVFNPKILDASIRDVTSGLADEQKVDVLLYAIGHLDFQRSRTLIENAVQSCLLINKLSPANATKARLMRAKARLASGLHVGAHQDLRAILALEPEHPGAKELMLQHVGDPGKSSVEPNSTPGFSTEVWREIASWLPPADLKTLLLVPHVLSRIASQLLFQKIDIYFTSEKWESQRSADILTRIITDPEFAKHVRTLRIFYQGRDIFPMTFQTGMLSNALPMLVNLKNVHCAMRWRDLLAVVKILDNVNIRLRGLSLMPSDGTSDLRLPKFRHITQFSIVSKGGSPSQVNDFLLQNKTSIRAIAIHNLSWTFPSEVISIRNLTHLDFLGAFPLDSGVFAEILQNGHQIESLRLQCVLDCAPSSQFRDFPRSLPFLRHFAFSLLGYSLNDHDLFPAVSDFLRDRKDLRTLQLTVPSADYAQRRLGYDATVWGVLPSLVGLKSLTATLPKDVAAAVAMWLVPRGVEALSLLAASSSTEALGFVSQLRPGLPPSLHFIGLTHFSAEDVTAVIETGFPMVRVARVGDNYYTVSRLDGKFELDEWPASRSPCKVNEWLDYYGCKDAEWRSPAEFL
ncbi:hypothetical protein BKA93DRAFT_788175 [Sparassis latifolia]|uniref:Uncharacterized protein n=1 Tax=Sparassis crispa TaxID=139825 RepID=A0A401GXC3_9APHY|nr:hypothetical protein SCP_1000720 [Sparassis crispa]GBE86830.1 hypothetical protein SCP_1000720 [Sparassis crispa]